MPILAMDGTFLPLCRHDGPKSQPAARRGHPKFRVSGLRLDLLSHGIVPAPAATSHSINALFFAEKFGNDLGRSKRTTSVPALTGPSGRVLQCFNAAT